MTDEPEIFHFDIAPKKPVKSVSIKAIIKGRMAMLVESWERWTEASRIVEMQGILWMCRDWELKPPPELLIWLAAALAGRTDVRPPIQKWKRVKSEPTETKKQMTQKRPEPTKTKAGKQQMEMFQ